MQIVQGSFHQLCNDVIINWQYLKGKEICIRDSTNDKMYARSYNYIGNGVCIIEDRPINAVYHMEMIGKKKKVTYEYLWLKLNIMVKNVN